MKRRTWTPPTAEQTAETWARGAAGFLLGDVASHVRRYRTDAERVQALRLAAAALQFAAETNMAADALERAEDLAAMVARPQEDARG